MLQNKIDKLASRISRDPVAINMLKEIISMFSSTIKENERIKSRLNGLPQDQYMEEVEKYIIVLEMLGYSQIDIQSINPHVLTFIANNFSELSRRPIASDLLRTQQWFHIFEFENNRIPDTISELKQYINNY